MKKLLLVLIFLIVSNTVYANGKILKSVFIDKSSSVEEGMDVKDPKNKIIIIYNHGQNKNDKKDNIKNRKNFFISTIL